MAASSRQNDLQEVEFMASLQSFRVQLTRLRRLSQPYFLPYSDSNGWQFALLLLSLLFCVEVDLLIRLLYIMPG